MKNRDAVLEGAQEAFFAANMAGYAGNGDGAVKTKSTDGKVSIEFIDGVYRVLDEYYVTPHAYYSFGTTVIFYKGNPIWKMSYEGWYRKEAIPFLKEALGITYGVGTFVGGRGPEVYTARDCLRYENTSKGAFPKFKGREEICRDNHQGCEFLGYHEYSGMSLI